MNKRILTPEALDKLGVVFVHLRYRERYGWTFEEYVERWKRGVEIEKVDVGY